MKCVICKHGETADGTTTMSIEREGALLVLRGVPARVCQNCGEAYISGEVADEVLRVAEEAREKNSEIDIRQFHAA